MSNFIQLPASGGGGGTTTTFVVASQAAQTALAASQGDIAVRSDILKSYILTNADPTVFSNWQEFLTPADVVSSVNGKVGTVTLTTTDVTEGTPLYFTPARAIASAITGYSSGSGTVGATDTILQAINKLNGNDALKLATASFTDAAVSGKLLTGYSSSAGTVAASDTILVGINKLNGNQVLSKATADAALPSASFTDAAVTGKLLTGYSSGSGTVAASDTILQAINKLNGNDGLKANLASPTFSGTIGTALTASRALQTDSSGNLAVNATTSTQLTLLSTAASADTVSTLVLRDSNGDFTSRIITSDGASTVVPFQVTNRSDTRASYGIAGATTVGMCFDTGGFTTIRGNSNGTNTMSLGSNVAAFVIARPTFLLPSGNLNVYAQGWLRYSNTTQTGNTANTLTTLFSSISLSNGDMATNQQSYRFRAMGTFAATANTDKQVQVVFGSTTLFDSGSLAVTAANAWEIDGIITRTGAATQKCFVRFTCNDNTNAPPKCTYTAGTETLAADLTLAIKGKGTSASDVVGEHLKVWWDPN